MFARLGRVIGYFSDTNARTACAVVILILAFAALELLIHLLLQRMALPPHGLAALDASIVGSSGGFAGWLLLRGNRERRQRVRTELARISELNHEVRNALQVLSHSHFDAKDEHREMVYASIDRIDAALRRLYPVIGASGDGTLMTRARAARSESKGQS